MPKMKTKKSASKRFFLTGSGNYKRSSSFRRHLLLCKSPKAKRQYRRDVVVHRSDVSSVRAMMPYSV